MLFSLLSLISQRAVPICFCVCLQLAQPKITTSGQKLCYCRSGSEDPQALASCPLGPASIVQLISFHWTGLAASCSPCALSDERGCCLDILWEAQYGFCWYFAGEVLLAGMSKSLIFSSWIHKYFERSSVVSIIQSPFPLKWVEKCLSSYDSHSWKKQKQILGDIFTNCKQVREPCGQCSWVCPLLSTGMYQAWI